MAIVIIRLSRDLCVIAAFNERETASYNLKNFIIFVTVIEFPTSAGVLCAKLKDSLTIEFTPGCSWGTAPTVTFIPEQPRSE